MNENKAPEENVTPEAIVPEAAAEETVAAPEGAPAVVQMVALTEEAEALPAMPAVEAMAEPVITTQPEAEPAAGVEEAPAVGAVEAASAVAAAASIRLEKKHPLAIRWMHWINFPVLATMIWSGLLIYWGDSKIDGSHQSAVYRAGIGKWTIFRFFPEWFWTWFPVSLGFGSRGGTAPLTTSPWGWGITFSLCGFSC